MAFQQPKKSPQFADLKVILAQTKDVDKSLYKLLETLIERLSQSAADSSTTDSTNGGTQGPQGPQGPAGDTGPAGPAPSGTGYAHVTGGILDQPATLPIPQADIAGLIAALASKASINHHITHEPGGSDAMAVDAIAATGSLRTLGSGANQAAPGNDTRFTNARPPTAHHATHEVGGSDALVNAAWTNQLNTFTQNQLISKLRADLQLQHQGDISKSHLQVVAPSNFIMANNLYYDGTQWNKDDTTLPGTLVDLTSGSFWIFTSAPSSNPASLTQILSVSPSGNLTIPGSISAAGGIAPGPHHTTHEPGGSDVIANVAWLNLKNSFTKEQTILNEAGDIVARFALMNMTNPLNQRKWLFWAYTDFLGIGQFFDDESGGQPSFELHRDGKFVAPGEVWINKNGLPRIVFNDTSKAAGHKVFDIVNNAELLIFAATDDAVANAVGFMFMDRAGVLHVPSGLGDTPLNASQLTSGILPDARLSSNVALKNIDNNFVPQTFTAWSSISGTNGALVFQDTSAPVDLKFWRVLNYNDGSLWVESLNDAQNAYASRFEFRRNGLFNAAYLGGDGQFITNLNAANIGTGIVNPARMGNGTADTTTFLRGDNTWAIPPGSAAAFPSGLIVFSVTPCPPGWTRVNWDGLMIRSGPVPGAQGGSYTHSHGPGSFASQNHTHGAGGLHENDHNHGGSVSISGSTSNDGNHAHGANLGFSNTTDTPTTGVGVPSGNGPYYGVSDSGHRHNFNGTASGNTDAGGAHSHSFSGSGGIPLDGSTIAGATAAAGALGIVGVSDTQPNSPPYIDVFFCQKN